MPNDSGLSSLFSHIPDGKKESSPSLFDDKNVPQVSETVTSVISEKSVEKKDISKKELTGIPEIVGDMSPKNTEMETSPSGTPAPITDAEKLRIFLKEDFVYQDMIRTVDINTIRSRLALRYLFLMFAIFLALVWVVNNRIIMFGFSEFQWLARIRDILFSVMAWLLSLTLWYGAPTWFRRTLLIFVLRFLGICFFVGVVSALYFPLW